VLNTTDSAGSGTTSVDGIDVNLTGTDNASGANTLTGLNFGNVTAHTNNTFNALTFGTGFDNFITSPSIAITGAGAITGATGITTSGNVSQTGAGTFSTGTGNVSLNGNTTDSGTLNVTGAGVFASTLEVHTLGSACSSRLSTFGSNQIPVWTGMVIN